MTISRREAIGMLGIAAAATLSPLLAEKGLAAKVSAPQAGNIWPYVILDPDTVAERSYRAYQQGHCMYGAFYGIVGELAQVKGAPFTSFPFHMMKYGAGGGADWGSLCGSLNGAAAAVSLVSANPKPIIDDLFGWYQHEHLPNYRPRHSTLDIAPSVSHSLNCHESVTRWCKASGCKSFSKERIERCGWLTASVSRQVTEFLNRQARDGFKPSYPIADKVEGCLDCHENGSPREDMRGKMECSPCHPNLEKNHQNL